jgi:hypothetical protein
MIKGKGLRFVCRLLAGAVILTIVGCGSGGDSRLENKAGGESAEPQTKIERDFILANPGLINATAYIFDLSERHSICKAEHAEHRKDADTVEQQLAAWRVNLDKRFVGDMQRGLMVKLDQKTKEKMRLKHQNDKPTLAQCGQVAQKILGKRLPPRVKSILMTTS